ncbi:hypothetical protein EV664_10381 [Stakelama pacifica]|uniref:Uncharacterized protein n=2 Tax=Stakelama pacifica TaxID=517720 RepID=A0A4R6FRS1_9SPHN|nr:hypothetical protein EV664_10381 [Stakelama pacifica]GGO93800.1 hypothetical protein GCM10011329_14100 [Stakelama pacifica]
MSGWLILGGVAALVVALLFVLGVSRSLWTFVLSALSLGGAGYALQGYPFMPGAPAQKSSEVAEIDQQMVDMREAMFGKITYERPIFIAADALMRKGATDSAVRLMLSAVDHQPRLASLWTWLGMAYVDHDKGTVSPAAQLAFEHAIALAPNHPGPRFFYGLALIRSGQFAAARGQWARAAALCPESADYCAGLKLRLNLLDRYLAATAEAQPDGR